MSNQCFSNKKEKKKEKYVDFINKYNVPDTMYLTLFFNVVG